MTEQFSKRDVKHAFSKAVNTYDAAAILQKEILQRLLDKLKILHPHEVKRIIDLGSGTGLAVKQLTDMFGEENYFAFDLSSSMLKFALHQYPEIKQHPVVGDVELLPFKQASFDIIFSSSTYQWSNDIGCALRESFDVLNTGGLFIFSTFGPETLIELRESFAKIDQQTHVSSFLDMHQLGDSLQAIGFSDVVMESEKITVEYSTPNKLLKDLRETGATNHLVSRAQHLMGKKRLQAMLDEYEKLKLASNKYPATYEVIYGHGWKRSQEQARQHSEQDSYPVQFKNLADY